MNNFSSEGKLPVVRQKCRWQGSSRSSKKHSDGVNWIHVTRGPVAGCCEHGDEHLGYMREGKLLHHIGKHELLKDDFATCCKDVNTHVFSWHKEINSSIAAVLFTSQCNYMLLWQQWCVIFQQYSDTVHVIRINSFLKKLTIS
jgi:hypothetical protein